MEEVIEKSLSDDEMWIRDITQALIQINNYDIVQICECINKLCEYFELYNGNNQHRTCKVKIDGIGSFGSKQELAIVLGMTTSTIRKYQNLAQSTSMLKSAVRNGKISATEGLKVARLSHDEQRQYIKDIVLI